ncbi:hypothetical protein C8R46DRAFT_1283973 [Mycena filopes]|nr:hypothetical protein C8R46DRAFT_1283973 [Mycena filopes]
MYGFTGPKKDHPSPRPGSSSSVETSFRLRRKLASMARNNNNNNNNNNHYHHLLPQFIGPGPSITLDEFRHRTTMTDSTSPDPHIPPFRGRQPIYHHLGPRFNARAVKFHALRMRLPLRTSHAACARYRLGQKNTTPSSPRCEIATADPLDIQLNTIYTHLLLLDTILAACVLPMPAVIRAPDHASTSGKIQQATKTYIVLIATIAPSFVP